MGVTPSVPSGVGPDLEAVAIIFYKASPCGGGKILGSGNAYVASCFRDFEINTNPAEREINVLTRCGNLNGFTASSYNPDDTTHGISFTFFRPDPLLFSFLAGATIVTDDESNVIGTFMPRGVDPPVVGAEVIVRKHSSDCGDGSGLFRHYVFPSMRFKSPVRERDGSFGVVRLEASLSYGSVRQIRRGVLCNLLQDTFILGDDEVMWYQSDASYVADYEVINFYEGIADLSSCDITPPDTGDVLPEIDDVDIGGILPVIDNIVVGG